MVRAQPSYATLAGKARQILLPPETRSGAPRQYTNAIFLRHPSPLSAGDVYALTGYLPMRQWTPSLAGQVFQEMPLTDRCSTKRALIAAPMLLIAAAAFTGNACAQSAAAEGQKLAFDRGKGNCLTCHAIKGGDLPGTIGPELKDIKSKYPDRNELVGIVFDETKRNPETVMPPFGRNRILTEQEINAVVDFLQTL
jgi:L-cysteine S-thiosulfotransferase